MARRPQSAFSFSMPRLMPGVRALMIALAVVTIGLNAMAHLLGAEDLAGRISSWILLRPLDIWHGRVWELLTYTFFFEGSPIWLIFALLMLWMFGTPLEQRWGTRRFLFFYFSTTALAGLAAAVAGLVIHSLGTSVNAGAWAASEALLAGYALSFPNQQVLAAFVLPIQARLLIPIALGITLVSVLMTGNVIEAVLPTLALFAGILLHDARDPRNLWLRVRVRWIERKMRRSRLRVVPGLPTDDELSSRRSGGRGSDGFLH